MNWFGALKRYPEANFLQSPEWGKVNELAGYQVVVRSLGSHSYCQMIVKNAKRARYLEVPGGPLTDWRDHKKVADAVEQIRQVAKKYHCAFARVRPQLPDTEANRQLFAKLGFQRAPMHLHAEHTIMMDLTQSEADLLAGMRRQTRYEVRRAEKQGIVVEKLSSEAIYREFQAVQAETAKRQGFIPPDLETLLAERAAFGEKAWIYRAVIPASAVAQDAAKGGGAVKNTETEVETVVKNNETGVENSGTTQMLPVAYGLILVCGREAEYFEAASTDLNRKHPGSTAILWQAMRDLKAMGLERFNLWGIAPEGQPEHRYAGVTTFKKGFGGEVVAYLPAQDLVLSKVRYLPDLIIERARKKRRHL